jgi:hypothetical protein
MLRHLTKPIAVHGIILVALCTACHVRFVRAAEPNPGERNLIHWGSLEGHLEDSGIPTGWTVYPPGYERIDVFAVTRPVQHGHRSLLLETTRPWASVITGQHSLTLNTRQRGMVWVSIPREQAGEALLRIDYLSKDGNTVGSSPAATHRWTGDSPGAAWTLLKVESRAAEFPVAVRMQLIAAIRGDGVAYWDDFQLFSEPVDTP